MRGLSRMNLLLLTLCFGVNAACIVDDLYGVNHKSSRAAPPAEPAAPPPPSIDPPPDPVDDGTTPPPPADTGTGGTGGPVGFNPMSVSDGTVTAEFWINVPAGYDEAAPTPVLYVYHGQGGNGQSFTQLWTPESEAGGFIVAGLTSQGTGWNFNTDLTATNLMIDEIDGLYNVDTERRYLMGYSAGAHWTHAVALSNSTIFAAYGVVAGAMEATGVTPAEATRKIPAAIVHRQDDAVVPFSYGQANAAALEAAGHIVYTNFPAVGGHLYYPNEDNPFIWGSIGGHTLQNPP